MESLQSPGQFKLLGQHAATLAAFAGTLLRCALEAPGFSVFEADCGDAALSLAAQKGSFALVISDVLMPGMSGVETCRRIREKLSVPIIMLTALGRDEDVVDGLEAGADDYCTKPVSLAQLSARIRAQLRRRQIHGSRRFAESLSMPCEEALARGYRVVRSYDEAVAYGLA